MRLKPGSANWRYMVIAGIWLIYLWYPLYAILTSQHEPEWLRAAGLIDLVAFVLVYLAGYLWPYEGRPGDRPRLIASFATLVLLACLLAYSAGANALATTPFLIAYSLFCLWPGLRVPLAIACAIIGLGLGWILADYETALSVTWPILFVLAAGIAVNSLMERGERELRLEQENLVIKERDKMARDVHDLIGHSLTLVALKAQVAQRLIDVDPDRAKAELSEIREITAEALEGVRSTVSEARVRSLRVELESVDDALGTSGIEVRVTGDQALVPARVRDAAAWILREAATNILRHSGATSCLIEVGRDRFIVSDDGPGGDVTEGSGISGMRKRAHSVGAKVVVSSAAGTGTKVVMTW